MKLSVITITCRTDPRFPEMARTLFASFRRAPPSTELEWIIVDDQLWWQDGERRLAPVLEALELLPAEVRSRIVIEHFAPPPGEHRGPDISDPLPAHNTARNAGLAVVAADAEFVVFLSDCTAVTGDWISVAIDVAAKNQGWKCPVHLLHDHVVPHDEPLRYRDSWDNLHAVLATTVAGPCWGVPRDALIAVGGFDADYDGEDDLYDHEILLRLGRSGVQFVTTKRACVVRMKRTQTKTCVTTRQEVLRAKRNQLYYTLLGQDRDRTLPGSRAAAASTGGRAIAGGGAAHRASRPVPARAPARVAPVPRAAAAGIRQPAPPPPRPLPPMPAPARPAGELGGSARTAAALTPAEQANHEKADYDIGEYVEVRVARYQELEQQWAAASADEQAEQPGLDAVAKEMDDLWAAMTPDERDQVDPAGAAARAPAPAPKPQTLHERAKAAEAARKELAAAEKAGTAPPPADDERCVYAPGQGSFKGTQCRLRARHGGSHAYGAPATAAPVPAAIARANPSGQAGVTVRPARPSREPPEPTAEVGAIRDKLDEQAAAIAKAFTKLPNDAARNVVLLGVILRREGVLATEGDYLNLLDEAIPVADMGDGETAEDAAARQLEIQRSLRGVQAICAKLPAIPCTVVEFKALGEYAADLDRWRATAGLGTRAELTIYNRSYAAAADVGIAVTSPDDFGDYAADDFTELERKLASDEEVDNVASVEPLTAEEAKAQEDAAAALAQMEAEAAAQGAEDAS